MGFLQHAAACLLAWYPVTPSPTAGGDQPPQKPRRNKESTRTSEDALGWAVLGPHPVPQRYGTGVPLRSAASTPYATPPRQAQDPGLWPLHGGFLHHRQCDRRQVPARPPRRQGRHPRPLPRDYGGGSSNPRYGGGGYPGGPWPGPHCGPAGRQPSFLVAQPGSQSARAREVQAGSVQCYCRGQCQ